ncbi:PhzF family phenazine biosynthesis protein [Muricauda sp. CAU 1633]|uniref:PhzF family phenazine biosynthesis protein n=1 Tax=Allomuricauda sp. CAU 1633 TaxID=2816036 RepID=UPI001A90B832|nr:PhzF family phenazine biosynthesis protein [Muricauda sp. CAU 1633]MBO0320863.1 PhzF family phenazine biosynthesis protein [Muricauda sp. CAU 1633]
MRQKIYQIDAFTNQKFGGNPAAVCILDSWLSPELMQKIAQENNLAETAFAVKKDELYEIRWFTPEVEVDLCGHATLASAFVLLHFYELEKDTIQFYSHRSGDLYVSKADNGWLTMDFPADNLVAIQNIEELYNAIGQAPIKTLKGKSDYMMIYGSQKDIETIQPNHHLLAQLDVRGVIVSAPGDEVDFVSRFFAPSCGIPEDPVTGSAHTSLSPYWTEVLNKTKMTAKQLSKRGGDLVCEISGERVKISGKAVPYLFGEIEI